MKITTYLIDGITYRPQGWLGCQLVSFEWKRVRAGTSRNIKFYNGTNQDIYVFATYDRRFRNWFKVETAWTIRSPVDLDTYNLQIRAFLEKLGDSL